MKTWRSKQETKNILFPQGALSMFSFTCFIEIQRLFHLPKSSILIDFYRKTQLEEIHLHLYPFLQVLVIVLGKDLLWLNSRLFWHLCWDLFASSHFSIEIKYWRIWKWFWGLKFLFKSNSIWGHMRGESKLLFNIETTKFMHVILLVCMYVFLYLFHSLVFRKRICAMKTFCFA